jgi:glutathione S-transferase
MAAVRIHGYLISTWTRTAAMTAVEKGVDFELVPLARFSPEHEAMHPFAKMPVLEHDGRFVIEGLAITGWLEEAFDGPSLVPDDLEVRTRMREWQSLCGDYVYRQVVRAVPRDREPTAEELAEACGVLERVEALVGDGPFLLGEQLTLADTYLAPQIAGVDEKAPRLLDPLEKIGAWFERIRARDSFTRTQYEPPKR